MADKSFKLSLSSIKRIFLFEQQKCHMFVCTDAKPIDVNICTPANGAYWLAGDLLIILMHQ